MKDKKYYYSFDSIKGISIFIVCICGHFWQFTPAEYWASGKYVWAVNMTNAVTHFAFQTYPVMELLFMISGFQMFASYNKIADGEEPFGQYLWRKVQRIFPLTILGTLLIAVGGLIYEGITGELWYDVSVTGTYLVENLLNIQSWVNVKHTLNGPLWYISVYFFCLLLFYFLCRIGKKTGLDLWVMLIPVLLGLYYSNRNMEVLLMNNDMARGYLGFFFGVLIAGLSEKIKGKAVRKLNVISAVMIILWFIMRYPLKEHLYGSLQDQVVVSMLFLFTPVLLVLANNERLDRIVGNKWLAYIGKISFSMYVLNIPFCMWILIIDKAFKWNLPYQMDYMFWITSVIQVYLATLVYRFFEKPVYKKLKTIGK
ncbi:MAG: acyltransferase [Clostridiales bacterium]|nr:acyltransferase [Candidatus Blautia equi]